MTKEIKKKQNLPVFNYQVYRTHGLIYVYAKDNDSFDQIARSMGFKAKQLMKFNEVPEDFPLQEGDIVYLEKKKKKADKPNYDHVVQVGESMHSIAQMYGIQIKSLYKMNKKDKESVATVSNSGVVTGVAVGNATITATGKTVRRRTT